MISKYKKNNSQYEDRDRFIINKGHSSMGVYPVPADIGYFPKTEIKKCLFEIMLKKYNSYNKI